MTPTPTTAKTNRHAKRQPYRQPPTLLAFIAVPLTLLAGVLFLGWLII